jgi:hypothetical protein
MIGNPPWPIFVAREFANILSIAFFSDENRSKMKPDEKRISGIENNPAILPDK